MPKKYIDAEEAKCIIEKLADELDKSSDINYVFALTDAILKIDDVPAADVEEVKHGEWEIIDITWEGVKKCRCNRCNECIYSSVMEAKFCPNCGAKMGGKKENNNAEKVH